MIQNHGFNQGEALTASDTVNAIYRFEAIYVGGAGNITVVNMAGNTTTLNSALAGHVLPVQGMRVNSTGTTASNLVGLHGGVRVVDATSAAA